MKAWIWENLISDFFFMSSLSYLFILANKRRQEMVIMRGREGERPVTLKTQKPPTVKY